MILLIKLKLKLKAGINKIEIKSVNKVKVEIKSGNKLKLKAG